MQTSSGPELALLGTGGWGAGMQKGIFGGANLTPAAVLEGALDAGISAGINTAVTGADFGQAFSNSMLKSVVSLGLADAQTKIGDIFTDAQGNPTNGGEGSLGHVLLHGLAGCAAAELQRADCASGAAGGIAAAIYSGTQTPPKLDDFGGDMEAFRPVYDAWRAELLAKADFMALATGYLFSGGKAENVSAASSVATSAVENNFLFHAEAQRKWEAEKEIENCQSGTTLCAENRVAELIALVAEIENTDRARDALLAFACRNPVTQLCVSTVRMAREAGNSYLRKTDREALAADWMNAARAGAGSGPAWDPQAFGLGLGAGALMGANIAAGAALVREASRICGASPVCTAAVVSQMIGAEITAEYAGGSVIVTTLDGTFLRTVDLSPPTLGAKTVRDQLIDSLVANGVAVTPRNVVDIRKVNGRTIWLETGTGTGDRPAGLMHIIAEHGNQFAQRGIPHSEIPDVLFAALKPDNVVGYQGRGMGRPIYEFEYRGNTYKIAITVGDNGFIVGANFR